MKKVRKYNTAKLNPERISIGLRPYLSASEPQYGEISALAKKVIPNEMPAHASR